MTGGYTKSRRKQIGRGRVACLLSGTTFPGGGELSGTCQGRGEGKGAAAHRVSPADAGLSPGDSSHLGLPPGLACCPLHPNAAAASEGAGLRGPLAGDEISARSSLPAWLRVWRHLVATDRGCLCTGAEGLAGGRWLGGRRDHLDPLWTLQGLLGTQGLKDRREGCRSQRRWNRSKALDWEF